MPSDTRNSILVVAVLIATATFQAGLNPPSGFHDDADPKTSEITNTTTTITTTVDGNTKTQLQGNLVVMFSSLNSMALAASARDYSDDSPHALEQRIALLVIDFPDS